jgi:hypothetical protein
MQTSKLNSKLEYLARVRRYDRFAPNEQTLERANTWMSLTDLLVDKIGLAQTGGVSIIHRKHKMGKPAARLEFYNDGETYVSFTYEEKEVDSAQVESFELALTSIKEHLDGRAHDA